MSLKEFHLVFVGAAILCSIAFGCWAVGQYARTPGFNYFVTAVGAFGLAFALVLYEIFFARKIKG